MPGPAVRYAPRDDGAHIGYWSMGDGPVLISWPGTMVASSALLTEPRCARMQRTLATFTTRVSMDRRGTGYSDPLPPGTHPSMEEQALDMVAVLDALGVDEAVVMANAWDAQATLHLAATRPERVARLILTSTSPCPISRDDWPFGVPDETLAAITADMGHPGADLGPADLPGIIAPSSLHDHELWTWVEESGRVAPATARAYAEVAAMTDARPLLPRISAPTLILHNVGDRWTRIEGARYMAEHIPDARLVEYDSPDHIVFTTDLDAKLAEIEAFLEGPVRVSAQRRLLTVLFTDVVGSTERLASTEDRRWTALLDEIDSTVNRVVTHHEGRVCKSMGDGHLALFERPSDAVGAALGIARALRSVEVDIRAGVHIGEVELRGEDVAGLAVHVGARVSGKAVGGEVLVTRTVADLLAGSPYVATDAGEHELKGLPGTWPLFRIGPDRG